MLFASIEFSFTTEKDLEAYKRLKEFLPHRHLWPHLKVPASVPQKLNLAEELLFKRVEEGMGQRPALYFVEEVISYAHLSAMVNSLTRGLRSLGIGSRDRVAMRSTNMPEAVVSNFALLKIGAIPVPLSPHYSWKEMASAIEKVEAKALMMSDEDLSAAPKPNCLKLIITMEPLFFSSLMEKQGELGGDVKRWERQGFVPLSRLMEEGEDAEGPVKLDREEVAFVLFTSGTSGRPKACVHLMGGALAVIEAVGRSVWGLRPEDVVGGSAPLTFAAGYGTFCLIPFRFGSAVSLLPKFSPEAMLKAIERHRVTVVTGLPTAYRKLLKEKELKGYDLSSVRLYTSGGDFLGKETLEAWQREVGKPIYEGFGSTECMHLIFSNALVPQGPKPGSVGMPLPGFEAKVLLNDKMEEGGPMEVGKLAIKGPTGAIYWSSRGKKEDLEEQRKKVKNGYTFTGDLAYKDHEGCFFIVGREEGMLKSSGYRISPREVEEVLLGHPMIEDALVVGIQHLEKGESLRAYLVLRKDAPLPPSQIEGELKALCERGLAYYKRPGEYLFVPALPKTATGKTRKP